MGAVPTPTPPTNDELAAMGRLAIQTIMVSGQRVTFNGRSWDGANLADLIAYVGGLEGSAGGTRTRVAAYCKGV